MLRPEYRDWYPDIVQGIWYTASWLSATVLEQQLRGQPRWAVEGRYPSDTHFVFRGGRSRTSSDMRTRRSDPPIRSQPSADKTELGG